MKLRFMSYNIEHGMDYKKALAGTHTIDLPMVAAEIRGQHPDIVGLNEVRGLGVQRDYTAQAEELAAILGLHCYFACAIRLDGVNPYGNAILSRFPIQSAQTITIPDPPVKDEDAYYETRCLLKAHFCEAGGFTVLIGHFGLSNSEKHNAVTTVCGQLNAVDEPAVIMGDFNMQPDDPILAPLLAVADDTAAAFTEPRFSYPSDHPRMKIDYILTRGGRSLSSDIPAIVASDHRPCVADIEIGEA